MHKKCLRSCSRGAKEIAKLTSLSHGGDDLFYLAIHRVVTDGDQPSGVLTGRQRNSNLFNLNVTVQGPLWPQPRPPSSNVQTWLL